MAPIARAILLALPALAMACDRPSSPSEVRLEGETMGTTFLVRLVAPLSEAQRVELGEAIQAALENVDATMSSYEPESEISRFNRAEKDVPMSISWETYEVLREAITVSEQTGGAFDVTVAPLVRLWGFGPGGSIPERPPSEEEIAAARARVGTGHLVLDNDGLSLTKRLDGLECDLSAIAKGYGVDQVAELLLERGHRHYMVEVGGEVRTLGKNSEGEAWRIGIEKPLLGSRRIHRILPLTGLSVATSGDYRNSYQLEGRLRSHLIDPRTGRPVEHRLASVSVVEQTCMRADALASALMVLGPEAGFELAVQQDLSVLFLLRSPDGRIEERATPAFEELFFELSTIEP